ncbi:MAG TPA: aspartate/glutamate racemase family protein [Chitinophagaceae bacterium]|nr:aspartate/glutamate racemase family protein [Chitinophagaceae bacterium]
MKTIGIIGGISWLSSAEYYRIINQLVNQQLGGVHSARLILYSVDYEEIKQLTFADNWAGIAEMIGSIAQALEAAGAHCILLGANTMHRIAKDVQARIRIPLLHIAQATGAAIRAAGLNSVALLGTKYTMELGFYQEVLTDFGIKVVLPDAADRQFVHDAIYNEMGKNIFLPATKARLLSIIDSVGKQGAQGVILGCTEIPLMIQQADSPLPVFDTSFIHAAAAVRFALSLPEDLPL